jgi:CheY-like chemotaxis protein
LSERAENKVRVGWRVLVVEDNEEVVANIKRVLGNLDPPIDVTVEQNFADGAEQAKTGRFDALILDVRDDACAEPDNEAGTRLFEEIKSKSFIPVVFYTAYQALLANEQDRKELVRIVPKSDGVARLAVVVSELLASPLVAFVRQFREVTDSVLREVFWDTLYEKKVGFGDGTESAHLLLNLFGREMTSPRLINGLLGRDTDASVPWHSASWYVSRVKGPVQTGDVLSDSQNTEWSVVITPACDLQGRSDTENPVLVASCLPIAAAVARTDKNVANFYKAFLENSKHTRFLYLPKFDLLAVPDLVVDLDALRTIRADSIAPAGEVLAPENINPTFVRAGLADPVSQHLQAKMAAHYVRIGLDHPDSKAILERLTSSPST